MKKIKQIDMDQNFSLFASNGEIEPFLVNGEMAHVTWYRQGNREVNGKYVIAIEYYPEELPAADLYLSR